MKKINTTVYRLPGAGFAEKDGTFVNSARWLQWKNVAVPPPGQCQTRSGNSGDDLPESSRTVSERRREIPGPDSECVVGYTNPYNPSLTEVAKEINGKALADITDPKTNVTHQSRTATAGLRVAER